MLAGRLDQEVFDNEAGKFAGVLLGYDFCAEHEWGIAQLKRSFGIPERPTREKYGADARTVTLVPNKQQLRFMMSKGRRYLMFDPRFEDFENQRFTAKGYDQMLGAYGEASLVTAWDEASFGLRMMSDPSNRLRELFYALCDKDAMIFLGSPKPMGGRGLVICIRSRVDTENLELLREGDLSLLDLRDAAAATGIAERLKAAGKHYFALEPRWANEAKTEVTFWLNPEDQRKNNFGWYTVKDLDDWIAGTGKVPMKSKVG